MSDDVHTLEYLAVLHPLNVLADSYGALSPLTMLESVAVPVLAAGWVHLRVAL
jgi:hypothetical protein